jgi:hypothetical protein
MTDPRIAALAEALLRVAYPSHDPAVDDPPVMEVGDLSDSGTETPWGLAAAILAALDATPAMLWDDLSYQAGLEDGRTEYEVEIARLNETLNSEIAECVRLRAIEEAARAVVEYYGPYYEGDAAEALRAALGEKP